MYRLFVAIDLPEDVKKTVAALETGLGGARWVPMEQLHLTLRFIGEVDELTFSAVKAALALVKEESFPLAIRGLGHFPPGKHPRVVWVGTEGGAPLIELQKEVELAVVKAGIAPEERKFSPHITIARLKETPPSAVATLEARQAAFQTPLFQVTEFHLYASTLTRSGAIHERQATYPLVL